MRKVIRIVTAALAVTALSLVAGLPLVAAWRMSAEQHATDLTSQQIQALWLVY